MDYVRFFILTLCLSAWMVGEVTPLGELPSPVAAAANVNAATNKEPKINSELTKDNLSDNKTLTVDHKKDDSNTPKVRKVSLVDSYEVVEKKEKPEIIVAATSKKSSSTTTATPPATSEAPKRHAVQVSEGVELIVPVVTTNVSTANKAIVEDKHTKPILLTNNTNTTAIPAKTNKVSDVNENVNHTNSNISNVNGSITAGDSKALSGTTNSTAGEKTSKIAPVGDKTKLAHKNATASTAATTSTTANSNNPKTSTTSTTSSSTSTSSTTTTTTTTPTTPSPKKPKITYGVEDFPDLDKESLAIHNLTQQQQTAPSTSSSSGKFPLPEAPYAQPSQEFSNTTFRGGRDYILPIVSMIFIIPLVIGILITTYRRFRDCWSTRHYRRMDFLVDGMYND